MKPPAVFGRRLAAARKNAGYATQAQAAAATGLGLATIARTETGRTRPTLDTATRLAAAYGTTVDALLTGQEPPP